MKKNYITKGYIEKLHDSQSKTGVYGTPPRVIRKGEKYRKALSMTQKFIYEELWELAGKASHKGQFDEKGNVYVEVSYSYMAVACDCSPNTAKNNLKGDGKYNQLFTMGLVSIKKRKDRETTEYYVHAPEYKGFDEAFLTNDPTTPSMKADIKEISAKRNKNTTTKRETENAEIAEERRQDSIVDTAEFEVAEREYQEKDDMPDIDEMAEESTEVPLQLVADTVPKPGKIPKMDKVVTTIKKPEPIDKWVETRYNDFTGYCEVFGMKKYANGIKEEHNLTVMYPKLTVTQIVTNFQKKGIRSTSVDLGAKY
ncbi:hypothetical protein [Metabacillus litoralis]|uniref:hypothetical protein n=1 Tax=Metabacillus litoralis TaxID=152268 RepID=UPI0020426471|nr:hypothetical protein [Metabacillus litoralis]MCM3411877.1 hypothetical protein [Metabacillus litoralis]